MFIRKTKFQAKVLLWLAVSESAMREPVFFKAVKKDKLDIQMSTSQYFINLSKNTTKTKKRVLA
jgi:hypothetical protein